MAAFNTVVVVGSLFNNDNMPVHRGKIHLYDDQNKFMTFFRTNENGRFGTILDLPLPPTLTFRLCKERQLIAEVSEDSTLIKERNETAEGIYEVVGAIKEGAMDIGVLTLSIQYPKEKVPLSYYFNLGTTIVKTALTKSFDKLKHKLCNRTPYTSADVQAAFGFGSIPLTSDNFFGFLTNGICPIYFQRASNGQLLAEVEWNRYAFDKKESLPNARVYFDDSQFDGNLDGSATSAQFQANLEGNATSAHLPVLTRIELQYRHTLHPSLDEADFDPVIVYLPGQDDFEVGQRACQSSFGLLGETVFHLGIGHVYGAKYAQQVHDYLQGTVLGELLIPHCQFIRKITFEIGKFITGADGVIDASALNVNGIDMSLLDTSASINPFSYKPRRVMWEGHHFAKAQQIAYKMIRAGVREYITTHRDRFLADWQRIHFFYAKRYRSSPFYRPWAGLDVENWIDSNEIGGSSRTRIPERTKYRDSDPQVKAMPWICRNPNGPSDLDLYWMELDVSHYIHTVTLYHSWIHRSQHYSGADAPPMTDLNFSPITLNNFGEGLNGGISVSEAETQEAVLNILTKFPAAKYAVTRCTDVVPELQQRFEDATPALLACHIDPHTEIQVASVI